MQPWVLILVVLLLAAVFVPLARVRAARRRHIASFALRNSWIYTAGDPWDLPAEMQALWLGTWGHDRLCRDVVSVPTQNGALWLAQFERQMSSGRHRRTDRFALALARVQTVRGGLAILPKDELFAATEPFHRYRNVTLPVMPAGRQIQAEHPSSEQATIARLAELCSDMPPAAAIEARGSIAAIYWPLDCRLCVETLQQLDAAGRQLIEILSSPACRESP